MIKELNMPNISNLEKQPLEDGGLDVGEKNRDHERPLEDEKESSREIMKQMVEYYNKLKELKGKSGADQLVNKMLQELECYNILHMTEQMTDIEEAKEEAFKKLEDMGYIEYSPKGDIICDIEKMKQGMSTEIMIKLGKVYSGKYLGKQSISQTLSLLFEDKQIISNEDYQKGVLEKKDLFYLPKNKEDALDIEKIKNSKFYLSLNDALRKTHYSSLSYGSIPKEDLDYREVLLPLLIYHSQYCGGYRDEKTGALMVKGEKGEYRRISAEYLLNKYGNLGRNDKAGGSLATARLFVRKNLPNLIENGLLKPDDFGITASGSTSKIERASRRTARRGQVMFDQVRYTLGNEYNPQNGNFQAYKIASNLGGIVEIDNDGEKKLIATFNIINPKDAKKTKAGHLKVGVKEAGVKKYDKTEIYNKRANESAEEYEARVKNYESFENVLKVSDYLSGETGANLADFTFKEQQLIATAAYEMRFKENDRFVDFVKKYGGDGLKTFAAIESDVKAGNRIMEIGEKLDDKSAWSIFRKYNEIIKIADGNKAEIFNLFKKRQNLSDKEIERITNNLFKKADQILIDFGKKIDKNQDFSREEIINELDEYKANLVLTASVWKAADKEGLNFEDLEGVSSERKTADEITKQGRAMNLVNEIYNREINEKQPFIPGANTRSAVSKYAAEASPEERESAREILEMIDIYGKHYAHKPKLREKLIQGFLDKLNTAGDKTAIYSFKKGGKILAFDRFDDLGKGRKYFGSFNVLPALTDSAIGAALLRASLDREAENNKIEADCFPEASISSHYVEKDGFVIKKVIQNYHDTGETLFNIERTQGNNKYYYKDSEVDIMKEHKDNPNNRIKINLPRFVLKFNIGSEEIVKATDELTKKGFIMTRYFFDNENEEAYCGFEKELKN